MDIAHSGRTRSTSSPALTVAIVDGDPLARSALRTRLAAEHDIEIVFEAADASMAVELVSSRRPALVLIGSSLPDRSCSEVIGEMHSVSPRTSIIVLALEEDEDAQIQALRVGAAGWLLKSIDLELLPRVLRGVRAGEAAVTRAAGTRVLEEVTGPGRSTLKRLRPVRSSLTQREWEVADLLVEGATTAEIASRLQVSPATVRTHVKNILGKLEVRSRDDAIRYVEQLRRRSGV
jgi:DNA-binding NarL/FixJ family response regulator